MDSKLHNGVPLSTTQMSMTPKAATLNTITGIRAPLTIDESDFEHSVSSKSRRNSTTSSYYSGSEESDDDNGYVSGGDEFETASERLFVHDPDEDILEETHFVKGYAFLGPFVKDPDGDKVQESSSSSSGNGNGFGLSRSIGKNPDGESGREGGNVVENALLRPYVRTLSGRVYRGDSSDSDYDDVRSFVGEENVENGGLFVKYDGPTPPLAVKGEGILDNEPLPVVSSETKPRLPIARISGDSDDDSLGSEVSDDDRFSRVARVQSTGVLQSFSFAPKARILDLEEEEDIESETDNTAEREFVEDLVVDNGVLGSRDDEEQFGIDDTVHGVISTDMTQDECPDASKELEESSFAADKDYNSVSRRNGDLLHLDDPQGKYEIDAEGNHADLVSPRELSDQVEATMFPGQVSYAASAAEIDCLCETEKHTKPKVVEFESSSTVGELFVNGGDSEIWDTGIEDNIVIIQDFESFKLENEREQKINQRIELFSSTDINDSESVHQGVDINQVPSIACPLFSELHEQSDMSNELQKNDNSTYVSSVSQSVLLGTKLEQEINNEAGTGELLPEEVEHTYSYVDTAVVQIENEQASTSQNGDPLEMHDQIVAYSDEEVNEVRVVSNDGKYTSVDDIESFCLSGDSTVHVAEARTPDLCASTSTNGKSEESLSEEEKQQLETIHQIREKYLWLLGRLGCSPVDSVAQKVLNQIAIAESRFSSRGLGLESAKKSAMELEVHTENDLDFCLNIYVIGKTGVGKSATINSLLGGREMVIDAFEPATIDVKETICAIDGVKVKFVDTPGFRTSLKDQSINKKILLSIKKRMQKSPPDVVLYVDRLDVQTSNFEDLSILKLVTTYLSSSVWRKCTIALTHATSLPPDGLDGHPLSRELLVAHQLSVLQQMISCSIGGTTALPVSLVENQRERELLHKGESWKSQLLLLCCSMKTLSELDSVMTTQNTMNPSLSLFSSSLLQCNVHPDESTRKETGWAENVAIPSPEMTVVSSHDADNPSLGRSSQLLTRPVLDFHEWDRDSGYNNIVIEDKMKVVSRLPATVSVQVSKDKKEFNILLRSSHSSQYLAGMSLKVNVGGRVNDKRSGRVCVRTSSSDQFQIVVVALVPLVKAIFKKFFPAEV